DLQDQIKEARRNFEAELSQAATEAALQAVRNRYLARDKGVIAAIMGQVAAAPPDQRPACGRAANDLKTTIEADIAARRAALGAAARPSAGVDVTLPGRLPPLGHRHPLTVVRDRLEEIFTRMGFTSVEGPEV